MRESVKKGLMRRGMAMFLTLVMALGLLPGAALADNESGASITLSVVDPKDKETYTVGETVTVKADVSGLSQDKVYYALEGEGQESGYQFLNADSTLTVTGKAAGDVTVKSGIYAGDEGGETVLATLTLTFVEPQAEKWTDKGAYDEVLYNRPMGNWYIYDAADLAAFAKKVNDGNTFEGKTVTLVSDIDLSEYEWVPIGVHPALCDKKKFMGTFEGEGHTVTGLNITTTTKYSKNAINANYGLFGYVENGTIRNISVKGEITIPEGNGVSSTYIGGLVGCLYGSGRTAGGTAENCVADVDITVKGTYSYVDKSGVNKAGTVAVGGLAGRGIYLNVIANSTSHGDITIADDAEAAAWEVGGLVGEVAGSYTDAALGARKVHNCYSTSTVTVEEVTGTIQKGTLFGVMSLNVATFTENDKQQPSFAAQ